jgi:hypothetical protein
MIQQRLCGGFTIPDRLERRELVLLLMALCVAQDNVVDRKLRSELIELEVKLFGENDNFMSEIEELLKT